MLSLSTARSSYHGPRAACYCCDPRKALLYDQHEWALAKLDSRALPVYGAHLPTFRHAPFPHYWQGRALDDDFTARLHSWPVVLHNCICPLNLSCADMPQALGH